MKKCRSTYVGCAKDALTHISVREYTNNSENQDGKLYFIEHQCLNRRSVEMDEKKKDRSRKPKSIDMTEGRSNRIVYRKIH